MSKTIIFENSIFFFTTTKKKFKSTVNFSLLHEYLVFEMTYKYILWSVYIQNLFFLSINTQLIYKYACPIRTQRLL